MTRTEAKHKLQCCKPWNKDSDEDDLFLNKLEALGLLKLDESLTAEGAVLAAVDASEFGCVYAHELSDILRSRNLKVVRA